MRASHEAAAADLVKMHEETLLEIKSDFEQRIEEQAKSHTDAIDSVKREAEQKSAEMLRQAEEADALKKTILSQFTETKQSLVLQETQVARYKAVVEDLHAKVSDSASLQGEIDRLRRTIEEASRTEASLNTEIQESLNALSTMEQALIESQNERERLNNQIGDLQKQAKAAAVAEELAKQLASSNDERDSLKAEVTRLTAVLSARRPVSPTAQGLGINGYGSRGSKDQETLLSIQTSYEGLGDMPVPSSPYPAVRHSSVTSLVNGSHPSSRPPPTPPPSMPPPPLPTEAFQNSYTNSINGHHAGASSSTVSFSNKGRESVSSVFTRDSHMDTMTSNRITSMADTISVDPRVHQKFEEQEAALNRLTKRLEHAETELKANIDLVTTLESALNDSERNLRKSRLHMNELSKEREALQNQNESLRHQVIEGQREVDNARQTLMLHEEESRKKLDAQKRAQREAQGNAEARMAEIQRLNRKSKFNVSNLFQNKALLMNMPELTHFCKLDYCSVFDMCMLLYTMKVLGVSFLYLSTRV